MATATEQPPEKPAPSYGEPGFRPTPEQLNEICEANAAWRRGEGGQRADLQGAHLRGADLRGADLQHANLTDASLRGANLRGADLRHADLWGADLRHAGLQGADLQGADLRHANLTDASLRGADLGDADLRHANLNGTHGDGVYIQSAALSPWPAAWTAEVLQIGCESHPIANWWDFDDDDIQEMSDDETDDGENAALDFWRLYKKPLRALIEARPCKPTRGGDDA